MSERICVVHIGTHKTGTTSQQNFLAGNWHELLSKGVLYVTAGFYEGLAGNHQVAWDLLSSDTSPHLDELVEELRATNAHTAILSAEDFSLLYARPRALEILRDAIAAAGFTPRILVYLRAQPPYLESHYVERIKQGFAVGLDPFVAQVLGHGFYEQPNSKIRVEFQYTRLLAPFIEVFGRENVMVRVFGASHDVGHVFQDFMQALAKLSPALAQTPFALSVKRPRENESLSFYDLLQRTRLTIDPDASELGTVAFARTFAPDVDAELLAARYSLLLRSEWVSLLDRFGEDNERIAAEFGAGIPFRTPADVPAADDARWAKTELERAVYDRNFALWTKRTTESRQP